MLPLLFITVLIAATSQESETLCPGNTVRGVIDTSAKVIETETLRLRFHHQPVRGKQYRIDPKGSTVLHFDLRSDWFDAYLVLREEDGTLLAEDDQGLSGSHARIVTEDLEPGMTYIIEACALRGDCGDFALQVRAGSPETVDRAAWLANGFRELESRLRFIEDETGEGSGTANVLELLGRYLVENMGDYKNAEAYYRRCVQMRKQSLGSKHPDTLQAMDDLGVVLTRQSRFDEGRTLAEAVLEVREEVLDEGHAHFSASYNNLGAICFYQGLYGDAQSLFEKALDIQKKVYGPEHPETLSTLCMLAMAIQSQGQDAKALRLLEQGVAAYERVLGPDHPGIILSLNQMAQIYVNMGKFEKAQSVLERSLAINEKTNSPTHPDTLTNLGNLAVVFKLQGNYEEARRVFERLIETHLEVSGPDHPALASCCHNLAVTLMDQGKYEEAMPHYRKAIDIRERILGPEHPETATTLCSIAVLHQILGEHDIARPLCERALKIREKNLGAEHPDTIVSLNNLAFLLQAQHNYEEAHALFEKIYHVKKRLYGQEHPGVALSLHNLASLVHEQGDYEKALSLFKQALGIKERLLGPEHPETLETMGNLAGVYYSQKQYEKAGPLLEKVIQSREKVLGREHPDLATDLNSLALVRQNQKKYEEALPLFERSLRILEKVLGPAHPDTAYGYSSLALLLYDLGRREEAWDYALQGTEAMAEHLARVRAAEAEYERYLHMMDYFWSLEALIGLSRAFNDPERQREAYERVLYWKGQVSRDLASLRRREPKERSAAQEKLYSDLRDVQSKLSAELDQPPEGVASRGQGEARRARLVKKRMDLERAIHQASEGDAAAHAFGLDTLAANLPADAALIDFFVHKVYDPAEVEGGVVVRKGLWRRKRLTAWVMRGDDRKLRCVDLGEAGTMGQRTDDFLEALRQGLVFARGVRDKSPPDPVALRNRGKVLRKALWDPLAEHLDGVDLVFVSPDRFLGKLPLGTLLEEEGDFLIEHRAFVYLQDMATLAEIGQSESPAVYPSLLVAGGVEYGRSSGTGRSWSSLPAAGAECRVVAAFHENRFGEKAPRLHLEGPSVTEERIKREMPEFDVIHLATHGFFRTREMRGPGALGEEPRYRESLPGLRSGLVLAAANEQAGMGELTAEEVSWLDLMDCDLVVLSACETSLGAEQGGEGMLGLRRAFRIAGARSVVASLWTVEDITTSELMESFYHNLWIEKMSRVEALRQAQLAMLRAHREEMGGEAVPYFWGAFVLDGDWK